MSESHIHYSVDQGVATLTLDRPAALNALTTTMIDTLDRYLDEIAVDDAIRAVIITGAGERAFAAGADIREFTTLADQEAAATFARRTHDVFEKVAALPKPVIAAINGFALGGALELALACDIRMAADTASVGLPEVTLGLLPGWGGTTRLVRLVGPGVAKLVILSGRRMSANEALTYGIIEAVYPKDSLMDEARSLARHFASLSSTALAFAKASIIDAHDMPLHDANMHEADLFGQAIVTEDGREGVQAFLEKRAAQWKGR